MPWPRPLRRPRTEKQIREAFARIRGSRLGPRDRYVHADALLDEYLELTKNAARLQ